MSKMPLRLKHWSLEPLNHNFVMVAFNFYLSVVETDIQNIFKYADLAQNAAFEAKSLCGTGKIKRRHLPPVASYWLCPLESQLNLKSSIV
jgi:hypothetical protein